MSASYFEEGRLGNRVFCYYGNTDDLFVDETLYPQTIIQALHRELRQHGYRRIVFYRHQLGAYCLDQASKDLWHSEREEGGEVFQADIGSSLGIAGLKNPTAPVEGAGCRQDTLPGVAGWKDSITYQMADRECGILRIGNISPIDMLHVAQRFMTNRIQTAVVFPEGADVLSDFYNYNGGRALNGFFASMSEPRLGQLHNRSVIIFLMDRTGCQIEQLLGRDGWEGIKRYFERRTTHHLIGLPGKDEVRNALSYMRLYGVCGEGRLQADVGQLEEISSMIAGKIARNATDWENNRRMPQFPKDELNARDLKEMIRYFGLFLERGEFLDLKTCRRICSKADAVPAVEQLNALTGMEKVKIRMQEYLRLGKRKGAFAEKMHLSYPSHPSRLRMREETPGNSTMTMTLHFLLLGKPGTGKSTVARLMGDILYENGFLATGHTVITSPGKLKGQYVGDSEANTRRAIEQAMGGVLFIDEAYGLANDDAFSPAILELLIQAMEEHRGDFSLIMAGYGSKMAELMNGKLGNVGLKGRFGDNIIEMEDYTPQELAEIFRHEARRLHCTVSDGLDALLPAFFANWYHEENDGKWENARKARNLAEAMDRRCEDGVLTSALIPQELQQYVTDEAEAGAL